MRHHPQRTRDQEARRAATPSRSSFRSSPSGSILKVLLRNTIGGDSLLIPQRVIVSSWPKRRNQRSTSQAGCEYLTLICRTGSRFRSG